MADPHDLLDDTDSITATPQPEGLDEASRIGWVLTAITCLVLLVGVAIIRYTSRDARPSGDRTAATSTLPALPPTTQQGGPDAARARPEPLVLRPTPPDEARPGMPRPLAPAIELLPQSMAPSLELTLEPKQSAPPSVRTATPNDSSLLR